MYCTVNLCNLNNLRCVRLCDCLHISIMAVPKGQARREEGRMLTKLSCLSLSPPPPPTPSQASYLLVACNLLRMTLSLSQRDTFEKAVLAS